MVYRYNYPMNFSADCHDPHTLIVDILNLIEHPLKKYPEQKKKKGISAKIANQSNSNAGYGSNAENSVVSPGMGSAISSSVRDMDETGSVAKSAS